MRLSEAEQRRLGSLVDQLRQELEQLATDEQDTLEWYIGKMRERAAILPAQPLSFFYGRLVGCIFSGCMAVRTVDAYWRALERAFLVLDPEIVSTWTVQDLLKVPGIIKHTGKLRGCILAAQFFLQIEREFGSFYSFLQPFGIPNTPAVERWSVVCLLANRIPWMGTAVACEFLKEVGLATYAKPDVHVKRALHRHGLTPTEKVDDYTCFMAVDKLARASGLEAAYVERILWVRGHKFGRW
jgi:3-methyladenine DNA glycosylase Tag